ncbi:stage VI sporulation protein D [Halobacillus mangrovi]|uniref:Stage VI sporulation protein D n=1 Tax=Halobacillus mangrovi TaxID=402384 RepID=A0A1W5ZUD8_9BACI|nr:stage VI sporulation protein D [Halobacillus mangrovi]ARI76916.1 stage VI sporulation protein D [Halobacillus mangrovi]
MQNKHNVFSFYLDESLWFKEGQGVRELIGISLEPEISIEDCGDEVCLRGTVDLAGEYVAVQEHNSYNDAPVQSARMMDQVQKGEEGVCYFSHSFPVEITVPLERVSSLDDVLVDIESFDYELPANHQLRLHAQLNINGIEEKEKEADNASQFDESATVGPVNYAEPKEEEIVRPIFPEREVPVVQLNNDYRNDDNQEEEDDGRWYYKKSQSFGEFFGQAEKPQMPEASPESVQMQESYESSSMMDQAESSPKSESSSESEESKEAPGGMDGIKQIFKHLFPNREDSYAQMKMYIAQEDETLESIAQKYEVTVSQLERANEYRGDVSPGQIVYIPS